MYVCICLNICMYEWSHIPKGYYLISHTQIYRQMRLKALKYSCTYLDTYLFMYVYVYMYVHTYLHKVRMYVEETYMYTYILVFCHPIHGHVRNRYIHFTYVDHVCMYEYIQVIKPCTYTLTCTNNTFCRIAHSRIYTSTHAESLNKYKHTYTQILEGHSPD